MPSHSSFASLGARPSARAGVFSRFARLLTVRAERRRLAELDDATLRDIGLSRDDALVEAGRPIWDVPSRWRR